MYIHDCKIIIIQDKIYDTASPYLFENFVNEPDSCILLGREEKNQ